MQQFRRVVSALLVAFFTTGAGAVTVSVDPAVEHQTIEGFGGFGLNLISTQSYLDKIIGDLGVTMIRTNTGEAGESTDQWVSWLNAVKARAAALGVPMKYIASCWSPPAHMKVNNSVSGLDASTNKLRPENYAAFGNVIKTYLDAVKTRCGIDYYGISFQNEPAFAQPYWSCVYTPTEYRDMVKVAGPIVHASHPNIKVFGAEHMLSNWGTFEGTLMADPLSKAQMGALAVHGYSDGVLPQPTSQAAQLWSRASRNAMSAGLPLWMTETSGYSHNWSGSFQLAQMIFAALKYGKLSAWVWWTISGSSATPEHIMVGENPTGHYYIHKHFARYIRPGAVMIDVASNDSLVLAAAFRHKTANTLTLILINGSASSRTVDLTGSGLPTFTKYVSISSAITCADQGTSGNSLTLPASSITTLYGQNYSPTVGVERGDARANAAVTRDAGSVVRTETYSLRGQKLVSSRVPTAGVGVRRSVYSDGTVGISPVLDGR